MAKRIVETHYDDLDESTDDLRTVNISLDGHAVAIDLSGRNYEKLSKLLSPYLKAGRAASTGAASRRRRGVAPAAKSVDTQAVRAWAVEHGIEVSPRGRISADVLTKYEAARR